MTVLSARRFRQTAVPNPLPTRGWGWPSVAILVAHRSLASIRPPSHFHRLSRNGK
jgi:hypothetical protein